MITDTRFIVRGVCVGKLGLMYDTIEIFDESEVLKAMECADNAFYESYKPNEGYDYVEVVEQSKEYEKEFYENGTFYGGWSEYHTSDKPTYRIYSPEYNGE